MLPGYMPIHTDAYKAFRKNLARPRALQAMFDAGSLKPRKGERRSSGKPTTQENELIRASVIVTIGALDAYLSDVAVEVLVTQLGTTQPRSDQARSLLRRILKEVDTLPLELALLSDQDDREAVVGDALRDHLTNKISNHGAKGVVATVERMGAQFDWTRLESRIPASLALSGDPAGPAGLLDAWTTRRHALVHQGKALRIRSPRARALVKFVEAIAEEVDRLAVDAIGVC
jgi:hypothetical protein